MFVNWAGTVTTSPRAWCAPSSEDELAAVVRAAARDGTRVRVVGAAHSWSRIAAPEDVAVSLDRMQGVLSVDEATGTAVVQGGTRLRRALSELGARGLTLPIVGSIAEQSVAGAIATGTHGSSLVHGNLSSLVAGARLITASGEAIDLGADDARLPGVRVHLGALGVVARVTLRVEPAFRLAETVEEVHLSAAALDLEGLARSAEYVKLWWLPPASRALVFRYARTSDPPSSRPSAATVRVIDEALFQRHVFPWLIAAGRRWPAWVPALNRGAARALSHGRRVGRSDLMLGTPMPLRHRETEAALPLARAGEAIDRVARLVRREGLPVNFPLEVRFVRGDDAWMSPAQGADTCQIGAYMAEARGIERYFEGFWAELRSLGGRPHWGKELDHTAPEVAALYPLGGRFARLRDELDPGRVFGSPFLDRTIGA